jgi:hypothetical protein
MYYYYRDKTGKVIGPLALETMAKLRFAEVIDGDTPVRATDSADWKPCREVIADPVREALSGPGWKPTRGQVVGTLAVVVFAAVMFYGGVNRKRLSGETESSTFGPGAGTGPRDRSTRQNSSPAEWQGACMNNLRIIEGAKDQWALEKRKGVGDVANAVDVAKYCKGNVFPVCPAGGAYTLNPIGPPATCSLHGDTLLACMNNLRIIDGAKDQWALEKRKGTGDVANAADVAEYCKGNVFPECPAGGAYTLNPIGTPATCSWLGHAQN